MATRNIRWNFPVANNRVFVHSNFGSDEYGDGSQQHPWRTLTHAVITKKASTNAYATDIVCVGYFSEDLPRLDNYTTTYGYGRTIRGNSFGEAVFDGKNVFNVWGYYTSNLIIMHCTSNRDSLNRASGFVGVGVSSAAGAAVYASDAANVSGVSGSSVVLHDCYIHFGSMKTNSSDPTRIIISKPKANKGFGYLYFGGSSYGASTFTQGTFYDVEVTERRKSRYAGSYRNMLFGKCAFITNDANNTSYTHCLFASDCKFYYFTGDTAANAYYEICSVADIAGTTDPISSINEKISDYNAAHGTTYPNITNNTFTSCLFSSQSSDTIMNDPENLDFTLNPNGDGITSGPYTGSDKLYYGALPPAKQVTWNIGTKDGCIELINGNVCLDTTNVSNHGSMLSDLICLNPAEFQISGVYGYHTPLFRSHRTLISEPKVFDASALKATISDGDEMKSVPIEQGIYIVKGILTYYDSNDETLGGLSDKQTLIVQEDGNYFKVTAGMESTNYLVPIIEPNNRDCVYMRCRATIPKVITADTPYPSATDEYIYYSNEHLYSGCYYINYGDASIKYHTDIIGPNEGFMALDDVTPFYAKTQNYKIGCLWDDHTTVINDISVPSPAYGGDVTPTVWVPSRLYGDYFVLKSNGSIVFDTDGVAYGSGNENSYNNNAETINTSLGTPTIANQPYVQFKIAVNKYDF